MDLRRSRNLFLLSLSLAIGWAVLCLFRYQSVLSCYDGVSHLYIPKNVIQNGPHLELHNLGTIWLFGFHLLVMPFVGIKYLYTTGLAGTIVNTLAFSLSAVLIYLILPNKFGLLASCLFIFNPYSLIYATTPMSEMTGVFFLLMSLYLFKRYIETRRLKLWLWTSLILSLGCLVRYELWVVTVGVILLFLIQSMKRKLNHLIVYAPLPLSGILLWLFYNFLFFQDPFIFLTHPCARVPLAVPYAGSWIEAVKHSLLMIYWISGLLLIPGVLGVIMLIKRRDPLYLLVILLLLSSLIHIPLGVTRHSLGYSRFYLYTLPALSIAGFGWVSYIKRPLLKKGLALLVLASVLPALPYFIHLIEKGGNSFIDYKDCQDIYYPQIAKDISLSQEIMERIGDGKVVLAFRQFYQLFSLSTGYPPSHFYDGYDKDRLDIMDRPWLYAPTVIIDSLNEVDKYWMSFIQGKYFNYRFFKDLEWQREFLQYYEEEFRFKSSIVFGKK